MWTSLSLLGILAVVSSGKPTFKVGSQYKYEVNSKTLTSYFQVSNQNSGVFIRGQLIITPVEENELICIISEPEIAQIHTTFPAAVDFDVSQISVHYRPWNFTKEPFVIRLKEGIIDELLVSRELSIWEVNIIRSIVSQFQVDTQGKRVIPSKLNSIPRDNGNTAVYKIMEDTVEGECEVLYDITPLPKYTLQNVRYFTSLFQLGEQERMIKVMKTKNFTNCEQRPGYHFGITGLTDWEPTINRMGTFLTRSSVGTVILSESLESYTIQSSMTISRIILSPTVTEHQKGNVISRVDVTLISAQPDYKTVKKPKNLQVLKKLVYDFNSPFNTDKETREKWDKRKKHQIYKPIDNSFTSIREVPERQNKKKEQITNKNFWSFGNVLEQFSSKRSVDDRTMVLSNDGWYQELPQMTQAPRTPFFPYFVGHSGHSIHNSKEANVNKAVKSLAMEIGLQLRNQTQAYKKDILEKFSILSSLMGTMNVKQLEQCVQEIYISEQENALKNFYARRNAWMTFRDALVQAGTGPALLTIVNLITSRKISGEEAAQVVSALPEAARYPTNEYLKSFFDLTKSTDVASQNNLNVSCIYAFTELVRMAQVNLKAAHNRYPVHTFGYFASQDDETVPKVYIPYFAQHLEKAVAEKDSHKIQTYITALGNIAHPKIVQVFKTYLEGKKPMTDFQRTLIVVSFNKLTMVHPRLARSVLYKIYANIGEVYQVRVAAVFTLMKANPPGSMLQRMAQYTHDDPSYQVRSAVKSAIESAAQLSSDLHSELRKNAESAVHLLVPTVFDNQYSRLNLTDYLLSELFFEFTQSLEHIGSEDSSVPKSIVYEVLGVQSGFKHTMFKVSGMVSRVQNVLSLFQGTPIFDDGKLYHIDSRTKDNNFTIDDIFKALNIDSIKKVQIEGNVFIKFGTLQRFFTFDNDTLKSLAQLINKTSQNLLKGQGYNYQKLFRDFEICIGLPLATGLPFSYTLQTPTYVGLNGKIEAKIPKIQTTEDILLALRTIQLSTNVNISFAKTVLGKMGFVTPFNHQYYLAGYKKQFQINLPVKGKFSWNIAENATEININLDDKNRDYELVHYSSIPFTAIQNIVDFKPILTNNNSKIVTCAPLKHNITYYGGKDLGMVLRQETETETSPFYLKKLLYNLMRSPDLISAAYFPMAHSAAKYNKFELYYDSKMSTAQTITLAANFYHIRTNDYLQEESGTEKNTDQDPQVRIKKLYQRAFTEINRGAISAVDFRIKIQANTLIEYVGSFAIDESSTEVPTKFLIYIHRTVEDKNFEFCFYGKRDDIYDGNPIEGLYSEFTSNVTTTLTFGEKCETGVKIEMSGKLERSKERHEYLQKLPQGQHCKSEIQEGWTFMSACKSTAGIMDKYKFIIQYQDVPDDVKYMINQGFSVLRHISSPYVAENKALSGDIQSNRVELDVHFSTDLKTANVLLTTPTGVTLFSNIPINDFGKEFLMTPSIISALRKPEWFYFLKQFKGHCKIDKMQAQTFSNHNYPLHLGNVWHVMSILIPEENSTKFNYFSVLIRETFNSHKEVRLSFGYPKSTLLRIAPGKSNQSNLFINDKQIYFDESGYYEFQDPLAHTFIQAHSKVTDQYKIIRIGHDLKLIYNQGSVQLILSEKYKNRIGGLCGVFNGEHFDYVTPRGYILQDPEEFAATWALSDEGHISELKRRAEEHSIHKKTTVLTNVVGEQDTGKADTLGRYHEDLNQDYDPYSLGSEESTGQDSECTTKRIMVIERDGRHCFSINPQTACKTGCQVEKTKTMNAEFICVSKSQTSSHWAHMAARGAQPNLKKKGNAQKIQFEAPEVCSTASLV